MRLLDIMREAWDALRAHTFRSLLTILGIIIGVFAVSMMLSLGQGVQKLIDAEINAFSQGDVSIQSSLDELREEDLAWLRQQPYTKSAIGYITTTQKIQIAEHTLEPTINFINGPFDQARTITITAGKSLDWNNSEQTDSVVVVDTQFEKKFKEKTGRSVYPGTLTIAGDQYTVRGVIKTGSGFAFGDGDVYLPYSFAATRFDRTAYTSIALNLFDKTRYEVVSDHVRAGLNAAYGYRVDDTNNFFISSDQAFIDQERKINLYFTLFLGAIGGIALLVGGIGTMNMMLTTVSERTKEIGVRKAVGAYDRDITRQVLCESIVLTSIGGLMGVLLTFLIALVANIVISQFFPGGAGGFSLAVNSFVVAVSVGVSVLIGVVFGWNPAKQAAQLPVVEALRSD